MKILDWYIIRKFIGSYVFAIGIFIALAVVFDLTEKIDGMLQRQAPLKEIIVDYYFNFIPYYSNLFSGLFTFITVIFFTSKLASKSEFVAILSSGVEFKRILLPYLFAAGLIAFSNWLLASWILPPANKNRIAFENKYIRGTFYYSKRNIHFQTHQGVMAYLETYSSPDSAGFRFTLEDLRNGTLSSKLICDRIVWNTAKQKWHLEGCVVREMPNDSTEKLTYLGNIDSALGFTPEEFGRPLVEDAALLNNRQLQEHINRERLKGSGGIEVFELEKHNRLAVPFSTFILAIMGVSLSSRKVRGGIGLQLGIGIGLCFVYVMMFRFSLTFATKGSLPPLFAAWTPNIIFGLLTAYLYRVAPPNNRSALVELHFVVFIWGFTAILGKLITLEALQLVWYRMILALVGVYAFARFTKVALWLPRKAQWALAGTGLIIAAHWVTFYHAIKISNVSVTLACFSSGAFFASIFEPLLYKRKVVWYEMLLGLVSIGGLYLIFSFEAQYLAGIITAIVSASLSALFAVMNGRFAQKYNAAAVSVYEMAGGIVGLSLLLLADTGYASGSYALSSSDLGFLAILAIVCTAYPFIASIRLMRKITPYTFVLSVNMEPIYGIILAWFIFGESERMTGQFYLGTAVILGTLFANAILKHYYRQKAHKLEKVGTFASQP